MYTLVRILRQWYGIFPLKFSVNDFIEEVKKWYREGHLDEGVWDHLRTVVNPEVVPTSFPSIGVTRKYSHDPSGGEEGDTSARSSVEDRVTENKY